MCARLKADALELVAGEAEVLPDLERELKVQCRSEVHLLMQRVLYRVSSSLSGLKDPSFRALSGRLKFKVRRHKFKKYYLS